MLDGGGHWPIGGSYWRQSCARTKLLASILVAPNNRGGRETFHNPASVSVSVCVCVCVCVWRWQLLRTVRVLHRSESRAVYPVYDIHACMPHVLMDGNDGNTSWWMSTMSKALSSSFPAVFVPAISLPVLASAATKIYSVCRPLQWIFGEWKRRTYCAQSSAEVILNYSVAMRMDLIGRSWTASSPDSRVVWLQKPCAEPGGRKKMAFNCDAGTTTKREGRTDGRMEECTRFPSRAGAATLEKIASRPPMRAADRTDSLWPPDSPSTTMKAAVSGHQFGDERSPAGAREVVATWRSKIFILCLLAETIVAVTKASSARWNKEAAQLSRFQIFCFAVVAGAKCSLRRPSVFFGCAA